MAGEQVVDDAPQGAVDETDDDFNAGFTPETAPTTTPAPTPDVPVAAVAPAPVAEVAPPKFAQITEEELSNLRTRAALVDEIGATSKRQFDTAFGKIGALEQLIAKQQTTTPAGEAVQIDESDFDELKREYPEFARMTVDGINKALAKVKGTAGDPEAIQKIVGAQVQAATSQLIDTTLNIVLPKWQQEVKTPQFHGWVKTQTPEVQALANSDKFEDAAEMLTLFAKFKNAPPAAAATAALSAAHAAASAPAATQAPTARQRQIAAAVPPKGDNGHPPGATEDDQFESGFKYRSR